MHHHSIAHRLPNKAAAVALELAKGQRLRPGTRKFVQRQRAISQKAKIRAAAKKAGRK